MAAEFGWNSDDPLSYLEVLRRYGSRANLDRWADAGDLDAHLWRSNPGRMDRLVKAAAAERAAATPPPTIARLSGAVSGERVEKVEKVTHPSAAPVPSKAGTLG